MEKCETLHKHKASTLPLQHPGCQDFQCNNNSYVDSKQCEPEDKAPMENEVYISPSFKDLPLESLGFISQSTGSMARCHYSVLLCFIYYINSNASAYVCALLK